MSIKLVRVIRGGSWYNLQKLARSAYRHGFDSSIRNINISFRLIEEESQPSKVLRGGSWSNEPQLVCSTIRNRIYSTIRLTNNGFRLIEETT